MIIEQKNRILPSFMMTYKQPKLILVGVILSIFAHGQTLSTQKQGNKETLSENINQAQKWWNLLHYKIDITPDYKKKYIAGTNSITFSALQSDTIIQIELQDPMRINNVNWKGKSLIFKRSKAGSYAIVFPTVIKAGDRQTISIDFEGEPKESLKPPYDNGWIWAKDVKGRPFISVACEGSGASIWLPCKEVLYDKPDNGVSFSITVADSLVAVSNGRLTKRSTNKQQTTTFTWQVINPINNYNIIPYIGKYVTWQENFAGSKGKLDCYYWVLDYNLAKAKKHFKQVDSLLKAFEYWAGAYPFYEDSYKLVDAPMDGMEHQSALAYGNGFTNGLHGKDLISGSGWGLKFDFIIVHESGHEWFGNSVTAIDGTHSWIHEGFAKYLETLYTSYIFGVEAGNDYALGTWKRIKNDEPIFGTTTTDQYYKGSAMLHMIRQITGDDLFKKVLTGLSKEFYHQSVSTDQILNFFNNYTRKDFTKIFDQYLKTIQIPRLSYSFKDSIFQYRWENCIEDFSMPVRITFDGKNYQFIFPSTRWQTFKVSMNSPKDFRVDRNFYITVSNNN
ncbi:MAG: M1 family metallopeptidase [Williamsia sp.]|nr:M1 family metallopeptidase [Williamsia sp.]